MELADSTGNAGCPGSGCVTAQALGRGGAVVVRLARTVWMRYLPHSNGWRLLLLCGWLVVLLPCGAVAAPLRISCPDMSPMTLVSVLVMKEAYDAIGQPFVLVGYSVPQALIAANRGDVDGVLHRIAGIERLAPELRRVLVPINMTEVTAVAARPGIQINDWYSLIAYRIGVRRGFVLYERLTAGMDVTLLDHPDQLMAMLDRGRLDLLAMLQEPAYRDLQARLTVLDAAPLHHYLHKRHEALMPRLRAALEKMQRSGRIRAIRLDVLARLERSEPLPALPVLLKPAPAP